MTTTTTYPALTDYQRESLEAFGEAHAHGSTTWREGGDPDELPATRQADLFAA